MSNPPATLPANFFESPAAAPATQQAASPPQTLPANFFEQPSQPQATMSAQPSTGQKVLQGAKNVLMDPFKLPEEIGSATEGIENYTPEGAKEHPVLAKLGELTKAMKDYISGPVASGVAATGGAGIGGPEALETVGEGAAKAASTVKGVVPSLKHAGQASEQLMTALEGHPVEITENLSKAAMRAQELSDNGNTLPTPMRKFLTRITDPEKGELTYREARDFMTKFGNMTSEETAKTAPAMKRQIDMVREALKESVGQTAERGGQLEKFQTSMKEYRNAKILEDVKKWATDFSLKGVGQKVGATYALKELHDILAGK